MGMLGVASDVVVGSSIMVVSKRLHVTRGEKLFGGVLQPPHSINDFQAFLLEPFVDGGL
jgi:hypothetical protein